MVKAAKSEDPYLWALTDHICRGCFGRVVMRQTFDRRHIYRCTNCGTEREGRAETVLCCCGIKLKTGVDVGIRCKRAEDPSPEFPSEIVATQAEVPGKN